MRVIDIRTRGGVIAIPLKEFKERYAQDYSVTVNGIAYDVKDVPRDYPVKPPEKEMPAVVMVEAPKAELGFVCKCGKEAKSKAGLSAHVRSCKN